MIAEVAQCELKVFEVVEVPHPEKLLFEGAEEALNAAVALGLADKVRGGLQPKRWSPSESDHSFTASRGRGDGRLVPVQVRVGESGLEAWGGGSAAGGPGTGRLA